MDEEVITLEELSDLFEYSCSLPTGTTIGKRWRLATAWNRRATETEWQIAEYVEHPDPDKVGIKWVWAVVEPGVPHRTPLNIGCGSDEQFMEVYRAAREKKKAGSERY